MQFVYINLMTLMSHDIWKTQAWNKQCQAFGKKRLAIALLNKTT